MTGLVILWSAIPRAVQAWFNGLRTFGTRIAAIKKTALQGSAHQRHAWPRMRGRIATRRKNAANTSPKVRLEERRTASGRLKLSCVVIGLSRPQPDIGPRSFGGIRGLRVRSIPPPTRSMLWWGVDRVAAVSGREARDARNRRRQCAPYPRSGGTQGDPSRADRTGSQ